MTTITITKEVSKEKELVVITRKQYEAFLAAYKKPIKVIKPIDPILLAAEKAEADFRAGRTSGPFETAAELFKHLDSISKRAQKA